jgi:hypothetical protein
MKAKILSYAGANKAIVDGGKQLLAVKLSVNSDHPAVGQMLEFDDKQVVEKTDKAEEPKKEEPKK